MSKNTFGDCVTGTLGGALTTYFAIGSILVFFTGQALDLGPALPITVTPGASFLEFLMVRLVQSIYYAGFACISFLAFRFMQEVLRGHHLKAAMHEAVEMPRLWP